MATGLLFSGEIWEYGGKHAQKNKYNSYLKSYRSFNFETLISEIQGNYTRHSALISQLFTHNICMLSGQVAQDTNITNTQ